MLLIIEEIKTFYFPSEFSDGCMCVINQILVDKNGNPIHAGTVETMKNTA